MANNPGTTSYSMSDGHVFAGRRKILLDYKYVDETNIMQVLEEALIIHEKNRWEINYLWDYYRGKQPILQRIKEIRPEICNKIIENRANEIVSFKSGYLMGEPIQYVSRGKVDDLEPLNLLNDWMASVDKASVDSELSDWMHICGTAYRMTLPEKDPERDHEEAPFGTYSVDPRDTFVVYSSSLVGEPPIMAVKYMQGRDNKFRYSCYTPSMYYLIEERPPASVVVERKINPMQTLPIIEYPLNKARLGAFEIVLTMLDAINDVASDRVDGVDQFIQSLMLFHNVDIDDEIFDKLRELGALAYADRNEQMKGEVKFITQELNQTQTQTLVDHMYETVLTICGMPNRNGGLSTSDTGSAVIMRDGWYAAEARAKDTELMFRKSEKKFLKLVFRIAKDIDPIDIKMSDIEVRFTRRNYDNIATKANVLSTLIDKIPPHTAYVASNMFVDPEAEYEEYEAWKREQEKKEERSGNGNEQELQSDTGDDQSDREIAEQR